MLLNIVWLELVMWPSQKPLHFPLFYRLLPLNKTLFSLPSIYLGFALVFFFFCNNSTFLVSIFRIVSQSYVFLLAPSFCTSPYVPKMRLSQYTDMELFFFNVSHSCADVTYNMLSYFFNYRLYKMIRNKLISIPTALDRSETFIFDVFCELF